MFRSAFLEEFPEAEPLLNSPEPQKNRALFETLEATGRNWVKWAEDRFAECEDLSGVVQTFIATEAVQSATDGGEPRRIPVAAMIESGPVIWRKMHGDALRWNGDPKAISEMIANVLKSVACGECRTHWANMVREFPPVVKTADQFFAWTVEVHNRVNERIGKPRITVSEAYAIYR
jgi:hypothetical protein